MARTIEVLLKRVAVRENGELRRGDAASLLSFSLAYPNPVTPEWTTVKALKLSDNADIDYTRDRHPDTDRPYTFTDRIVFKETIAGRTELTVSLATVIRTSKLEKFLASVFGAVFDAA